MKDMSVIDGLKGNVCDELHTVFNKGYEQGYEDGKKAFNEQEYDKGLAAAWEVAKIINNLFCADLEKIFGDVDGWTKYSAAEAMDMIMKYNSNRIQVGDEVVKEEGDFFIVTKVCDDHLECIDHGGGAYEWIDFDDVERTGKHYKLEVKEISYD